MAKEKTGIKVAATNRRAHHEYFILETIEAGIALTGTEVKSLRQGKANVNDAFARVDNGECILYDMHISPYDFGNRFNPDPRRPRKLLLHKKEIMKLQSVIEKGEKEEAIQAALNVIRKNRPELLKEAVDY